MVLSIRMRSLAAFAALLLAACGAADGLPGSGVSASEVRELTEAFEHVDIDGKGKIEITCGKAPSLRITGDDNHLPLIQSQVANGRLRIWSTEELAPNTPLVYRVEMASLRQLTTRGAVSGDIRDVASADLALEVLGAGSIDVTGKVERFSSTASGAGKVRAFGLEAGSASVSINGAGSAEVFAVNDLEVTINGAGKVRYRGDPKISKTVNGLGSVSKDGE